VKFKMAEKSLFAILLRSSWWVSFAIAAGVTKSRSVSCQQADFQNTHIAPGICPS